MKNKNKLIILLLILLVFTTGCTKQLKNADGKVVKNETTGQTLPSNILCAPTDSENIKLYNETREKLITKYQKQLDKKKISKKEYNKKVNNLLDISKLEKCSKFTPMSNGYEGLWTTFFVKTLSWVLIKIGMLVGNYGLGIIITTILIRLVLYPLTLKTAKQSEVLAKAKPELDKLEKKYAGKTDQENMMKKSQEMMVIYKKYNINPLAGCIFAFLQIPLFLAFFEAMNRLPILFEDQLVFKMAVTPLNGMQHGNFLYIILPILVALTTYFSFKLNKTASTGSGDQAKQMNTMMTVMTIMIIFMSFTMSSAIIFYWITNSAFTIVQNLLVKRSMKND